MSDERRGGASRGGLHLATPASPRRPSPVARRSPRAPVRVVGIDWSGDRTAARRKIWRCDVDAGGVRHLANGVDAAGTVAALVRLAHEVPQLVVGLDFGFSFPAWFVDTLGGDARGAWEAARAHGDAWLREPRWPFWRRARPADVPEHLRRTDREAAVRARLAPSSLFKLVGAGQVGAASVRGMSCLLALQDAGFAVWPFDAPRAGAPLVVEVWPRLCYGERVTKRDAGARAAWLGRRAPTLAPAFRDAAVASDDAFDALAAALALWAARETLGTLPPARDPIEAREGRIWFPPTGA